MKINRLRMVAAIATFVCVCVLVEMMLLVASTGSYEFHLGKLAVGLDRRALGIYWRNQRLCSLPPFIAGLPLALGALADVARNLLRARRGL